MRLTAGGLFSVLLVRTNMNSGYEEYVVRAFLFRDKSFQGLPLKVRHDALHDVMGLFR
jgi:hypothetical protein